MNAFGFRAKAMPGGRSLRLAIGLGMCLMLAGCSSFGREWRAAETPAPEFPIAGRWEGAWKSETNRHRGRVRAILTPAPDQDYNAWIQSSYWRIFRHTTRVRLEATALDQAIPPRHVQLAGEEDLGMAGAFNYQGTARPDQIRLRYDSRYDQGLMHLHRPEGELPTRAAAAEAIEAETRAAISAATALAAPAAEPAAAAPAAAPAPEAAPAPAQ